MAQCRRVWWCVALALAACNADGARHKAAGNVLFKAGDIDGALGEYRAAVALAPGDANAHTLVGNALFEKAAYDEARREYQTALASDGRARAALQGLATIALRQGHADEARALYQKMVSDEPRDADAQAALGRLLYAAGDLDGADHHLRDALVYAQNDAASLYTLGLVQARKKDTAQAAELFDRLERLAPGRAYAPYGRAVAAAAVGHSDEALAQLALALQRGVDSVAQVAADPALASLRGDPRFIQLTAAAHAPAPSPAPR